jgi:hypothetical protein
MLCLDGTVNMSREGARAIGEGLKERSRAELGLIEARLSEAKGSGEGASKATKELRHARDVQGLQRVEIQ